LPPIAKNLVIRSYDRFAVWHKTIRRTNWQFGSVVVPWEICQICGWKCEKSPLLPWCWKWTFDQVRDEIAWYNSTPSMVWENQLGGPGLGTLALHPSIPTTLSVIDLLHYYCMLYIWYADNETIYGIDTLNDRRQW